MGNQIPLDHLNAALSCRGHRGQCNCCRDDGHWTVKSRRFSTDYEKQNDWKVPRGRAPMIVSDPTTYVESMRGSVCDLSCALQQIPLQCLVKSALLQYRSFLPSPTSVGLESLWSVSLQTLWKSNLTAAYFCFLHLLDVRRVWGEEQNNVSNVAEHYSSNSFVERS